MRCKNKFKIKHNIDKEGNLNKLQNYPYPTGPVPWRIMTSITAPYLENTSKRAP